MKLFRTYASHHKRAGQAGFTIVELMIALSILSVLLVACAVVLTQIGGLYDKGVNSSRLQNATRNVASDVSRTLQFSGVAPASCNATDNSATCYMGSPQSYSDPAAKIGGIMVYAYCINTTRYSYVLDREVNPNPDQNTQTYHALWRDTMKTSANCNPLDLTQKNPTDSNTVDGSGQELVPIRMRLTRFKVTQPQANVGVYDIDVWMAYGPDDLVVTNTDPTKGPVGHSTCQNGTGTQFCAVSELSTVVTRRLQ